MTREQEYLIVQRVLEGDTNAFEELAKTDAEKESIRKYQERVVQFQELETKLKDLRAQIRDLYTADGKLDTKKIRELQFEANATANRIETLDRITPGRKF